MMTNELKRGTLEYAEWLADKVHSSTDYGKSAASLLVSTAKALAAVQDEAEALRSRVEAAEAKVVWVQAGLTEFPDSVTFTNRLGLVVSKEWLQGFEYARKLVLLNAVPQPAAPEPKEIEHRPGCDALGGYGHGVGPCSCGAAPVAVQAAPLTFDQIKVEAIRCGLSGDELTDVFELGVRSAEAAHGIGIKQPGSET